MTTLSPPTTDTSLLSLLLSGERFWPTEPKCAHDLGLSETFLDTMVAKLLLSSGSVSGRGIATELCLPFKITEAALERLRNRRLVTHVGSSSFNDYVYGLSDEGRSRAQSFHGSCSYIGPAPVPLDDYVISVEAQATGEDPIRRGELSDSFQDISIAGDLLDLLGPAVNSGSGMFLYGAPGNGKSTLADRITSCFGQEIWLPYAIIDGGQIITLFDPAYHRAAESPNATTDWDARWVRVSRPTVVVGGELTMENLEIRHDSVTHVSEAPLQMKSNCGCLLIDDFGRQRISPEALLNRWIVPLENQVDYLTLANGKKLQVPFRQLIIFSTNLAPSDLVDEAFLRRIPYRIELTDPDEEEFHHLFQIAANTIGCYYDPDGVDHLLNHYYRPFNRPLRRCHARDLLLQIKHYCTYNELPFEMLAEHFDRIVGGFFTEIETLGNRSSGGPAV
ncbi:MAG: AAA family ATPase [Fuerstiella sp.]|nr:AAA family ATPase [Fuerstiella sp.]